MSVSPWVIDVGDGDFEQQVLAGSETTPVVVDFWAPWCAPCRTLGPVLERLAQEHDGAFVLAKVNVDEAPAVAQTFGIRSIPAVMGFRDGALVGQFVGAQPEAAVRQFLAGVLPTEADCLVREGLTLAATDPTGAETTLRAALEREARHPRALLGLARLLAERDAVADALPLLERISPNAPVAREAERLAAALRTRLDGTGDEAALRARVTADPTDVGARLALGRALAASGRHEAALAELLEVVQRDRHYDDDGARRAMLDLFEVLGPQHPLTDRYRSELAKALFR
jgi:putative thioredoxin